VGLVLGLLADAVVDAAAAARRAVVTRDLDFADPTRFPPGETSGLIVLRVHDRPGRQDLDAVIERLIMALEHADSTRREPTPWSAASTSPALRAARRQRTDAPIGPGL
jgi:hypothetical protein